MYINVIAVLLLKKKLWFIVQFQTNYSSNNKTRIQQSVIT